MADEYIRKQDAVEECGEWYVEEGTEEGFIGTVSQMLNMFSTADVEPVAYGRWVYVDDDDMRYDTYYCSECRNRITVDSHRRDDIGFTIDDMERCNKCGAIMDAQEEE